MTYLHASVSRNPLSRASAVYLLETIAPFSEGMALRTVLATLPAHVHTHRFPQLHDMRVHAHVASDLPLPDVPWVVTDGALAGDRICRRISFYSPLLGVLRSYSFGVSASCRITSQGLVQPSQLPSRWHRIHALWIHQAPFPLPPSSTTSSDSWWPPRWGPKGFGCERNMTWVTHTRWRCSSGNLTC